MVRDAREDGRWRIEDGIRLIRYSILYPQSSIFHSPSSILLPFNPKTHWLLAIFSIQQIRRFAARKRRTRAGCWRRCEMTIRCHRAGLVGAAVEANLRFPQGSRFRFARQAMDLWPVHELCQPIRRKVPGSPCRAGFLLRITSTFTFPRHYREHRSCGPVAKSEVR